MMLTSWSEPVFSKAAISIADEMARNFRTEPADAAGPARPDLGTKNDPEHELQVTIGAPPGTRTPNPQIKSLLLCQLS
jgi:hypothetical protein